MEDDLHPHLKYISQLSREVVFIMAILQRDQLLLPKERHTTDLKGVRSWEEAVFLAQMEVADPLSLIDLEEAIFVAVVNVVADVVGESGQRWGELQDVVMVAQITDVQVKLQSVLDVHTGQTHHLIISQLSIRALCC